MVLELPCFDSDYGLDHFEVFAGDMAVTTAELKDSWVLSFVCCCHGKGLDKAAYISSRKA